MKKKDKLINNINPIEEVQIGLENGKWKKNYYQDTGRRVKDGDFAYKISLPTIFGEDDIYFENYVEAQKYLKDFE